MFGDGPEGFLAKAPCDGKLVGEKTAVCKADGTYGDTQDNCGLQREPEQPELLEQSEVMQVTACSYINKGDISCGCCVYDLIYCLAKKKKKHKLEM